MLGLLRNTAVQRDHYNSVIDALDQTAVVLVSDELTRGFLLLDFTFRNSKGECHASHSADTEKDLEALNSHVKPAHGRVGLETSYRERLSQNETLASYVRRLNSIDHALYKTAKARFDRDFAEMEQMLKNGETCKVAKPGVS